MAQYYGESQWPGAGPAAPPQNTWDHQTPPPPRSSGANSAVPREDLAAFSYQLEEVERAIDNLVKSGKMFGAPGRHGRAVSGHHAPRHSVEFSEGRGGGHSGPNLQNFYAAQRHQSSRGSNEAEQMMQAKRRMAAQRERELRNYHQEQQYNRNAMPDVPYAKSDRAMSPGNLSEDDRRDLIARQRSALYGEGHYDETGNARSGLPGLPTTTLSQRGPSPLAFDYGRPAPDGALSVDAQTLSRANSNASPQSNAHANFGAARTSNSSPTGGSPPGMGVASRQGPGGSAVAPIGTRPSASSQGLNPILTKSSTTPLPSPLSHGVSASGSGQQIGQASATSGAPSNPTSAAADGYNGWGNRSGVWSNKSNLGVQASVWG
ncbi:hypothetical protein F5Y18DRAFT_429123 [Xylariaceae sp. FL1019]|nr:hypothetical protein F5Y18DRAFT_429123 [Xylariaceae sp. FL1019]